MKKLSALILVFLSFTQTVHGAQVFDCVKGISSLRFTSNVDGFSDRIVTLQESKQKLGTALEIKYTALLTKGAKNYSEADLFTDPSDLIVGISADGNTQGHTYLIINGQRFDGRMFFAPDTVTKSDWTLSKGLIIRYKNLPQETKDLFAAFLDSKKVFRTATCVASACHVIYDIGEFQNRPDKYYWFPSHFLKFLASTGLTTKDGTRLVPEIYAINSDITSMWNNLPNMVKVPNFLLQVLFDPYTWAGAKKKN